MRGILLCFCGGAAATMTGVVAAATGFDPGRMSFSAKSSEVAVNRALKKDRIASPDAFQVKEGHKIATVEVVGLEQAAIIYRDRQGRILFRTDPLGDTTVIMRGVVLPEVTVRSAVRAPAQPVIMQPPATAPPAPVRKEPKLPQGCEPASSALSASSSSAIGARCFTAVPAGPRLASLR